MKPATKATASVAAIALLAFAMVLQPVATSSAETMQLTKPLAGSTMFFADRFATAYYTIDNDNFRTVVTIAPGPDGKGNPMQLTNSLVDGESAEYSVGGFGENTIKVTLKLTRHGDKIIASVTTDETASNS